MIIAEASRRLGENAAQLCPSQDWRLIRDFGNIIRHDYDGVDHEVVWKSIQVYLPALQADVTEALLKFDFA